MLALCALGLLVAVGPGRSNNGTAALTGQVAAAAGAPANADTAGRWLPSESTWGEQLRATTFASPRGNSASSGGFGGGVSYTPALRSGLTKALPWEANGEWTSIPLRGKDRRKVDDDGDETAVEQRGDGKTYRTMCVRLCDGYYWPVNYAVTKDQFNDDAAACARTCGGPGDAKLFTYRNPGGDIEEMEDSEGRAYKKLQNAFLFRTKYEASCKCRPHPWEDASADRHKAYSLIADVRKGDRVAAQKLKDLRVKLQVNAQTELKAKAEAARGKNPAKAAKAAPAGRVEKVTAATAENADTDPSMAPLTETVTTSAVQKVNIIRGDQKSSGRLQGVPQTLRAAQSGNASNVPQTRVVRVRAGGGQVQSLPVPSKALQKAADVRESTGAPLSVQR